MTGSLVAEPEDEDVEPLNWEGAGAASSWADLADAVSAEEVDPFQVGFTAAGAGLDTLGAVLRPLDSLVEAGIGWLIEHIAFLHEPLDALAGDPTQITAQAKTWHSVSAELTAIGKDYRTMATQLPGWSGEAAEGYRAAVDRFARALDASAAQAEQLSGLVLMTGAGVGTVRALVRDLIAEFLSAVLQYVLAFGALAAVTAGAGVGGMVLSIVVRAIELAQAISRRLSALLSTLAAAGGVAGRIGTGLQNTAAAVRAASPALRATGRQIEDTADALHAGKIVEAGKQTTGSLQEQRGWE
ncbi:PPE domain-containing protein [Actinomycetes bacterium KLBMP 9759]